MGCSFYIIKIVINIFLSGSLKTFKISRIKVNYLEQCLVHSSCATTVNFLLFLFVLNFFHSLETFLLIPCDIQLKA